MTDAGLAAIETAKKNGSWTTLDDVEARVVPRELQSALSGTCNGEDELGRLQSGLSQTVPLLARQRQSVPRHVRRGSRRLPTVPRPA